MQKYIIKTSLLISMSFLFTACKHNGDNAIEPDNPNEQEQITTLHVIIKDGVTVIDTFSFIDIDGPGGNAPIKETIKLIANKNYTANLLLLDQSKVPAENISTGVLEEKNEHQFFYTVTAANLDVIYNDTDDYGVPLGLETLVNTAAASTGKIHVVLKHQPNEKPKTGAGNSTLGDTDLDVSFNVTIQ